MHYNEYNIKLPVVVPGNTIRQTICHFWIRQTLWNNKKTPQGTLQIIVQESCYILQSSFLSETQWIYRNFIGWELTKPGHISIMRQVMTNKKYQSWTSLAFRAHISPTTFRVFMQSFLTRTRKSQKRKQIWNCSDFASSPFMQCATWNVSIENIEHIEISVHLNELFGIFLFYLDATDCFFGASLIVMYTWWGNWLSFRDALFWLILIVLLRLHLNPT